MIARFIPVALCGLAGAAITASSAATNVTYAITKVADTPSQAIAATVAM